MSAAEDEWFATRGFRVEVHETDYSGMVRIRQQLPGEEEPKRFSVDLVGGQFTLPYYGSGDSPGEARALARDRYLAEGEGREPLGALSWPAPVLSARAGDGAWAPEVSTTLGNWAVSTLEK